MCMLSVNDVIYQIFTRRRFLYAQWEKRYRHVRILI